MHIIYRFFLVFLPLFLCSVESPEVNKQILHVNFLGGAPKSLNPHLCRDIYSSILFKALYEGLTRINLDEKVELALARKIEISKCKTKYTIYLRSSKWSNGKTLTALHFVSAWKSAVKPDTRCVHPYRFFPIKNAEKVFLGKLPLEKLGVYAPSEDKIVIHLEHPAPYFTQLLADPIFSPLFDVVDFDNQAFNGPFIIDNFQPNEEILLKKSPLYWDVKNVKLDGVSIALVRDAVTAYELYQKGELDFIGSPFSDLSQEVMHNSKMKEKKVCAPHWLHMNTKHPKLRSKNIRKALSLAIDRKYITSHILLNSSNSSTIIPQEISSLKDRSISNTTEEIQKLFYRGLQEIGCEAKDFVITLGYSSSAGHEQLVAFLKHQWEKIFYIRVNLDKKDWGTFFSKLNSRNYCVGGTTRFTTFEHPLYFLEYFYNGKNNYSTWENKNFQKWVDLANQATDEKALKKYLAKAEEILEDECPVIPVYTHKNLYLCSPKLKGFYPGRLVYTDFKWAYFE